jgi:hypothetical protein
MFLKPEQICGRIFSLVHEWYFFCGGSVFREVAELFYGLNPTWARSSSGPHEMGSFPAGQ